VGVTAFARRLTKKVCLLGDFAVGKTSLVRRFVEGRFDERYLSTIGVKVDRKVLHLPAADGEVVLTLMVWDLAGGPEIGPVVPGYYRGAAGAIVVCDVTRPETLDGLRRYAGEFLAVNPLCAARLVVTANKMDLDEERRLADEDLQAAAAEVGAPLFLTSARTGEQVDAMFYQFGLLLL
jgi:small GTP-binding protein